MCKYGRSAIEAEGVWNYIVFGALPINFPKNSGLSQLHYWPVSSGSLPKIAAHAWCVVPPFGVVDLTIKNKVYLINTKHLSQTMLLVTMQKIILRKLTI